jgi:hypothetical protein
MPIALPVFCMLNCFRLLCFGESPDISEKFRRLSVQGSHLVCEESEQGIGLLSSKAEDHPGVYLPLFHLVGGR